MRKVLIFKILILFSIFSSCKHSNTKPDITSLVKEYPQIIDINKGFDNRKELPLSEIASDVEYVKLEFTKNSLIKSINQIYITDDYVFVLSLGVVLQFDRSGQFIRQVGTIGRGPQEYIQCLYFSVDEMNNRILIRSLGINKLLCYSFNGEYQKSISTIGYISQFSILSTGEIVCSAQSDPELWLSPDNFIVLSIDDKGDTKFLKKSWFYRNFKSTWFSGHNFYSRNDSVYIKEFYRDTIYLYKDHCLIPHYILLWDKFKEPNIYSFTAFGKQEILDNSAKTFQLRQMLETSNYFYMYYQYQNKNYLGRFNNKTGEIDFSEEKNRQGCLKNDFDGGMSVNPKFDGGNNKWIAELSAGDILQTLTKDFFAISKAKYPGKKEKLKLLVENVTENDNPIIMIISFK